MKHIKTETVKFHTFEMTDSQCADVLIYLNTVNHAMEPNVVMFKEALMNRHLED